MLQKTSMENLESLAESNIEILEDDGRKYAYLLDISDKDEAISIFSKVREIKIDINKVEQAKFDGALYWRVPVYDN